MPDKLKPRRRERVSALKDETKSAAAKQKQTGANTLSDNRLELIITVVSRDKAEYYVDLIQSFEVNMQMVALANGTADANTLSLLGLTDTEKAVLIGVIQQNRIKDMCAVLDDKFRTIKGGKGIAFTVPLTSVIGKLIYGFLSNNKNFAAREN